jgi:hypothetical protein
MNYRAAFARSGGDTADLLEMRHAAQAGNSTRVAQLRAEGRGACCEFHASAAGFETRTATTRRVLTDEEVVEIAIRFYETEGR